MPEPLSDIHKNPCGTVAYVLKRFPRLSETFIASEVFRLEQVGVRLRLYVIKPQKEEKHHAVVDRINARPEYLPAATSLSGTPLTQWLAGNLPTFLPGLLGVLARHPVGIARAVWSALSQAMRARPSFWNYPLKAYLKEFLQATALADRLLCAPDVGHLHAHFCHGATTVTWLASMITGIPFSFTAHANDIYREALNPAGLLRRKMDAARFVVTCTEANRRHLQTLSKTRVYCIYHGLNVDLSRLIDEQSAPLERNRHLRALAVGRLVRKKGFDIFVDACGILKRRGLAFDAVIAGESGDHESEIKRRIAQHQLAKHVRLIGPLSQRDLFEEYSRASAFCLPCRVLENGDRDGIPNVLTEAMACGVPAITTAVSGIPEIITDNVNGLLVPTDNPEALADALLRIDRDPVLAQQLSRAGRKIVREKFDGEKSAGQLADLFRQVMR